MNLESLKEIGLTDGQIRVYSAVLELGRPNLNAIHEKTGIERRNIYDILNKLIEKGLISYIDEKKTTKYRCTNPNKILEDIRLKESRLKDLEKQLPQINTILNSDITEIDAQIYRGIDAMKMMFNEMLDYKESYWMGGNSFEAYSALPESFFIWFDHWMNRRVEKKHLMHDLVSYGTHLKNLEPNKKGKYKILHYEYKQLPKGMNLPIVICIYGDKVAQISWSDKFAFVLQSKKVKEGYLKYIKYFRKEK
jgi:predicted DNA-binding transcriptional regulator